MPVFQAFNKKIKAWVKYELYKDKKKIKAKIINVKQKEPMEPFKGVPKRGHGR